MLSKRNRALVREFRGRVMPFRKLPVSAQLAIAWYMAVDGEAWELPPEYPPYGVSFEKIKREFTSMRPFFVKTYGRKKFGYVDVPTEALVEAVMQDEEMDRFPSFEEYHRWYVSQGHMPRHGPRDRWPVILSSYNEETLQDGWHRFHHYIRQGARMIPAVYYP